MEVAPRAHVRPREGPLGKHLCPVSPGVVGMGLMLVFFLFFPFPPDILAFPQAAPFADGADSSR